MINIVSAAEDCNPTSDETGEGERLSDFMPERFATYFDRWVKYWPKRSFIVKRSYASPWFHQKQKKDKSKFLTLFPALAPSGNRSVPSPAGFFCGDRVAVSAALCCFSVCFILVASSCVRRTPCRGGRCSFSVRGGLFLLYKSEADQPAEDGRPVHSRFLQAIFLSLFQPRFRFNR